MTNLRKQDSDSIRLALDRISRVGPLGMLFERLATAMWRTEYRYPNRMFINYSQLSRKARHTALMAKWYVEMNRYSTRKVLLLRAYLSR